MIDRVLVTGGAGYVGSHVVRALRDAGTPVVVVDDLSQGHPDAVRGSHLEIADYGDRARVERILRDHDVRSVIHMGGSSLVGTSVEDPGPYYANNVVNTFSLLGACRAAGVDRFVFSSSAAVYGEPNTVPIPESHPTLPTNPYGETKLAVERILKWYAAPYGIRSTALRYFNAAGAHPDGTLVERHDPETHLIPIILRAVLDGTAAVRVFGSDYDTPDGTCVRDYVHVADLAAAHVAALRWLDLSSSASSDDGVFNLGNGRGFSVLDVVRSVERVTGAELSVDRGPRRAGDPAVLVASSDRAREVLEWSPALPEIDDIVATAWNALRLAGTEAESASH